MLGNGTPFVIGRDTRESGRRIELDLVTGLRVEGVHAKELGVLPTPAVAYLAGQDGAPAAMISASHNPWRDNGIKLFAPGGRKLDDEVERDIERVLREVLDEPPPSGSFGTRGVGWDESERYVEHLAAVVAHSDLSSLRVAMDCANGAASEVGPRVMRAVGIEPSVLHASPNGRNINDHCGSTHPEDLQRLVVDGGFDLGLALDGDADRVIMVDEQGELVDGDQIMVMAALDLHARGLLRNDAIAVTVMSNLGLRHALREAGVHVVETPVGDRNVLVALDEHDLVLGGEQSGHIVFRDHATTGDGLLTGLLVLDLVHRAQRPLSALAGLMTRYPQVLVNVGVGRRPELEGAPAVDAAVRAAEARLGDEGRVLVRSSGTEPVVRVMVEAASTERADAEARRLVAVVEAAFGGS